MKWGLYAIAAIALALGCGYAYLKVESFLYFAVAVLALDAARRR